MSESNKIVVLGARVHNLKNIDVEIPRNSLTVITGLSGSGKSSLAFDTIYAEGQRRYIETFSAYARNFLGNLERPDVDKITGLSPVISIEQKTTNKNPRSTVGTTTEIYDFLRLLFARAGEAFSYVSGEKMGKYTEEQILDLLLKNYQGHKVYLLAPKVKNRKGHYKELFESVRRKGYLYVRVDGEIQEVVQGMRVDRYRNHDIELVVDRLVVQSKDDKRLTQSVANAMAQGDGMMMVYDVGSGQVGHFSRRLMCPVSGISYRDPAPHDFSFNSPTGACPKCKGLGYVNLVDINKVFPDRSLSVRQGGIAPLGKSRQTMIFWQIQALIESNGFTLDTPLAEMDDELLDEILNGSSERLRIPAETTKTSNDFYTDYEGLVKYIRQMQDADMSAGAQKWADSFSRTTKCPHCNGQRLNQQALHFRIAGKNIAELAAMDLSELYEWLQDLDGKLTPRQLRIAGEIVKEIRTRLRFLLDVGLDYLSLSRPSVSLSGGESQRIRLATQIGSQLVNVLYILDEPSIGLHQRDNRRLINSLKALRDLGNTVIVVEHDQEMMEHADYIVDIGPGAGIHGGEVVFSGTPQEIMECEESLTGQYLSGKKKIPVPEKRREGNGAFLEVYGAAENNLRDIDVRIPLGTFTCVTGVSGSGKSSLVNSVIYKSLAHELNGAKTFPGKVRKIDGMMHLDKVINIDQSPIGRTPRSNPATYTSLFTDIRDLFASTNGAKARGYGPSRFSFNVRGGRCEACQGDGIIKIEMHFLPDVYIPCEVCKGKRYNRETLEVKYKDRSISDVLEMTVEEGVNFFENHPKIRRKLQTLYDVGLSYIKIGQPSTTLSGGEAQRVKLATELAKRSTGQTIYILDEPTTGLHTADVQMLISVLQRLVDAGNTVLVIEHNLDIIKTADYIIDLGPEGGDRGGTVVATGTPEHVATVKESHTGVYLKKML